MDLVYKYSNYYYRNLCSEGCPIHTICQWGFCICDEGKVKEIIFWRNVSYKYKLTTSLVTDVT